MRNQALGLAERLNGTVTEQTVTVNPPLSWLPVGWRPANPDKLGPAPALAIGCGRAAIPYLLSMKRRGWPTKTCYVQDPRIDPTNFDLVVAPSHDRLTGPNVVSTLGSMHRIHADKLTTETRPFADQLARYKNPLAVLIGGRSAAFDFTPDTANHLCDQLLAIGNHSLLVTASRRTGKEAADILKKRLGTHSHIWLYDGEGPNPYFAFLAAAQAVLVTQDSVNMATEAVATGKPVFVLPQPVRSARKAAKFERFHGELYRLERAAPFTGALNGAPLAPFDNAAAAVARLNDFLTHA
ncbi:MAG: mitochondrial fission ELM1 family protein [Alphaproteobacteria bacterium]